MEEINYLENWWDSSLAINFTCFSCIYFTALPDFARVYRFFGNIFDPNTESHIEKLNEMDPIDIQTVGLLFLVALLRIRSPKSDKWRSMIMNRKRKKIWCKNSTAVHSQGWELHPMIAAGFHYQPRERSQCVSLYGCPKNFLILWYTLLPQSVEHTFE